MNVSADACTFAVEMAKTCFWQTPFKLTGAWEETRIRAAQNGTGTKRVVMLSIIMPDSLAFVAHCLTVCVDDRWLLGACRIIRSSDSSFWHFSCRLVNNAMVALLDSCQPTLPEDVTSEKWGELHAQGWRHYSNFFWPLTATSAQLLSNLRTAYGISGVMTGHAMHPHSKRFKHRFPAGATMIGIYVKG